MDTQAARNNRYEFELFASPMHDFATYARAHAMAGDLRLEKDSEQEERERERERERGRVWPKHK